MLDGLLIVDKPSGWTSHDVVAKVRRLAGVRRTGHAGTLDPMATGVLPLGIGKGTRVLEYLSDGDKAYRATIRLGATTTTEDAEGEVTATADTSGITEGQLRSALAAFQGDIEQIPPAYSAIKQGGTPLYRLARAGVTVQPAPRRVIIHRIVIQSIVLPDVTIEVTCSKGTYIRSLARDLGAALGCGAHLAALRRLRTGPFSEQDAHTLPVIEQAAAGHTFASFLLPPDAALVALPALKLNPEQAWLTGTGRAIPIPSGVAVQTGSLLRALDEQGRFLAILRAGTGTLLPHKVFEPATGTGKPADEAL